MLQPGKLKRKTGFLFAMRNNLKVLRLLAAAKKYVATLHQSLDFSISD